jgi:PPP family 3-phenylpropionic acid transporter
VVSMLPLVGLLAQPFWGQAADRSGARSGVLALVVAGAALGQLVLWQASGFVQLLAATSLLALFSSAVMPLALSVTLAVVQLDGRHAFGIARAVGTVGYLVLVVTFPLALQALSLAGDADASATARAFARLDLMFPAVAALTVVAGAIAWTLPHQGAVAARAGRGGLAALLRHGPLLRVLAFTFVAYLFLNGPIQLFPLFVRSLGGGVEDVSRMWVWMLLLEIPLVAWSGSLRTRLGARGLLVIGVVASGLRWAGSAFVDDMSVATALGLLHGVAVLGLGLGGPLYVEEVVPEVLRSTGQALLSAIGIGLGGILSNLACGWLFDRAGAQATYLACGLCALALALVAPLVLPVPSRAGARSRSDA